MVFETPNPFRISHNLSWGGNGYIFCLELDILNPKILERSQGLFDDENHISDGSGVTVGTPEKENIVTSFYGKGKYCNFMVVF